MINNLLKPRTWLRATSSRLAAFLLAAFAASCAWAATPLAVWDGNFPSSSEGLNGITVYPMNGATVDEGIVTVSSDSGSTGPAFATVGSSVKYKYMSVAFKADFTGVTFADGQVLVAFGDDAYITYSGTQYTTNARCGIRIKSNGNGGFYATGIWNGTEYNAGDYTTGDDSSNVISLTGEQTLLATYSCTGGTYLYVLDDGSAKPLYSGGGLKSDQVAMYKIGIGGGYGSLSGKSRMGGLKLKSVAIYGSNDSLPLSSIDLATYAFPTKFVEGSGESVSISDMNAAATPAWVLASSGSTVVVDAEPDSDVMFVGSGFAMSGSTITAADGVALDLADTTLTSLTLDLGTTLPTVANVGSTPVTVIVDDDDSGSIAITGGSDDYTYKIRKTGGRLLPATYSNGTLTYTLTATTAQTITLTADTSLSSLLSTIGDVGGSSCDLTITDDGSDHVLTVDYDIATGSITFAGSGTTTLAIADGATFTAGTTFANSGSGSVIVRVDAGGTAEINGKANFLAVPAKFVLNGGSLVNNGSNISTDVRQITTLELTADSTVGGTKYFGLIGAGYGNTTLTLNGHTLVVDFTGTANEKLFILNSALVPDDGGTIRVDAGVLALYCLSGSARQNVLNCTVQLNNEFYMTTDTSYSGGTYGYCELFMADASQPTVKNVFATNAKGGTITGYANNRILTITGTLGLPFKATITPNITLANGATVKALTGDGAACPTYGLTVANDSTIYVDVSDITLTQTTPIFTWTSSTIPNGTFVFTDENLRTTYELLKEDGGLYIRQYTSRSTVNGVVTPSYSLTTAIQNADEGTEVDVFTDSTESAVTVSKDATISMGANNVTINTLTVSADSTLTLVGSGAFTLGAITGEGALSLDLTGYTGSLSLPVGANIATLTGASNKITVTGTVAKGKTLFTVGSGSYTPATVYSAALASDVHYTLNAETGAYVVGKMYYWRRNVTSNTDNKCYAKRADNWTMDAAGATVANEIPVIGDTMVFNKAAEDGTTLVRLDDADFNCNIEVLSSVKFHIRGSASHEIGNFSGATLSVASDVQLTLDAANGGADFAVYSKLTGKGTILANIESNGSEIKFYGDASEFDGVVKVRNNISNTGYYGVIAIASVTALDNSRAKWDITTEGRTISRDSTYNGYTPFALNSQTYKFGVLNCVLGVSKWANSRITLEPGYIDEDSSLRGTWMDDNETYGGTVKWVAPTATFTQAITNAYNVTLAGGGNVYVEKDTTEGGVATTYIPTQLNFTDNGGYLTIDDDNAAIAEGIIGAINTTTAGVGLNVTAANAVTVAAPAALQSGVSFNKKGGGEIALTGITSLGTVTVAEGTLTTPDVAYTLGATTGVTDNGDTLTFYYSEAAIGTTYYSTLAGALQYVQSGETVTLLKNAASVELPQGASLATNGFTVDSITAAGGGILVLDNGVYTAYAANAAETWTGNGGDSLWSNAANWDKGYVPLATTPVTIPSTGATIYIGNWWDSRNGVRDECARCASLTLNGNLTLAWDDYQIYSGGMYIYGPVSGTGTLTLKSVWFCNGNGSEGAPIEISTPLALVSKRFEPPAGDTSWQAYTRDTSLRDGPFTLKGATTLSGYVYLPAKITLDAVGSMTVSGAENHVQGASSVFNGAVTVVSGAALYSTGGGCTYSGDLTINGSFYTWGASRDVFSGAITLADGARLDAWNRLGYEFNDATITCNGSNGAWLWFGNNDGENNAPYATGSGVTIYGRVNFSGDTLTGDSAKTTAVPEIRCPVKLAPYATLVLDNGSVAVNSAEGGSIAPEFPAIYSIDSTTAPNEYICFFPEASNAPAIDMTAASPVVVSADGVTFAVDVSSLKVGLYYRVKAFDGNGAATAASTAKVLYDGTNANDLKLLTAALPTDGVLYYTIEASDTAE